MKMNLTMKEGYIKFAPELTFAQVQAFIGRHKRLRWNPHHMEEFKRLKRERRIAEHMEFKRMDRERWIARAKG
tara:strand:+ start:217 stop:435 length:219 start_codon:yes stop_codon:yes gene_type:complete